LSSRDSSDAVRRYDKSEVANAGVGSGTATGVSGSGGTASSAAAARSLDHCQVAHNNTAGMSAIDTSTTIGPAPD
jgi:hypothetical protein